jgi:sugar/nucleoside kinase (ribokinase family)
MGHLKDIDVLVIGRSCLDYIAVVNKFPQENQKVSLAFRLTEGGGQGGTAACCISTLGGRVAYVGKLGDDPEGRACLNRLTRFGVSSEFIDIVKGGKTPVAYAFITRATGDRTIVYEPNMLPKIELNDTLIRLIDQAGVVLIDPEGTHLGREIKSLRGEAIKLVYDCERWRDGIEDIFTVADYVVPSAEFLEADELNLGFAPFNEKIFQLNKRVSGNLIVTHGENGAYYPAEDHLYHVRAPVVNAVDTIGAGDNFHAAFALALAKGFDLHRAVSFSVAVASLSCREYGGRKGVPTMNAALEVAHGLAVRKVG